MATPQLSAEAKSLIRALIVPSGKQRLSIHKIKQHDFFKPISFRDVEKCRIEMPMVRQRDPKSGDFDEVEPDSCDEDFQHEFEELNARDNSDSGEDDGNFAHLPSRGGGKGNRTHQVSDGLNRDNFAAQIATSQDNLKVRLPTTFQPRDTSICVSQDSAFYNHDPAKSQNDERDTSQVLL